MPNWCEGDLYIRGNKVAVDSLLERIATDINSIEQDVRNGEEISVSKFDFNRIIPYPKKYQWKNDKTDGYNSGGYEWCVKHWGTKWNAVDAIVERTTRGAVIHFRTAWAPPAPVIVKLIKLFPALSFKLKYYETGMGFRGELVGKDGKLVSDVTKKYRGPRGG